jgi:hypothetical protein
MLDKTPDAECPKTFSDVMAKLSCGDVKTRVVETQAQHLDAFLGRDSVLRPEFDLFGGAIPELGGYHTVTSMQCGSGIENKVLILQNGSSIEAPALRDAANAQSKNTATVDPKGLWQANGLKKDMEAIAWDPRGGPLGTGVYNYYALEPDDHRSGDCKKFGACQEFKWKYFGSSADYIVVDEDLKPNHNFPADETLRCAACHTGGGLIMRELDSPWVNWEEDFETPGADELISAHPELGRDIGRFAGNDMENAVVIDGNALWDKERIKLVTNRDIFDSPKAMLKPLFCPNEVNVQTSRDTSVSNIRNDFFVDPMLDRNGFEAVDDVRFEESIYQDAIDGAQFIPNLTAGIPGLPSFPAFGIFDTAGAFMYPERSGADRRYLQQLKRDGFIDDALIQAVLAVDFTRPLFSDTRCNILRSMDLSWDDVMDGDSLTPESLRVGIQDKLIADAAFLSPGASIMLDNLSNPDNNNAVAKLDTFANACEDRARTEPAALMKDLLHVANVRREKAYTLPLYKFIPTSMPVGIAVSGGGVTPNARLHAVTCQLELVEAEVIDSGDDTPVQGEGNAGEFTGSNNTKVAIPDNDSTGITSTIEVGGDALNAREIEVRVEVEHTWRGDLAIRLTSPSGETHDVRVFNSGDSGDGFNDVFEVTGFDTGADARGTWTLKVADRAGQDTGNLVSWSLGINTAAP